MFESIARNWWVFTIRGVIAIFFGALAFVRPDITLLALVVMFGVYALADGVMSLIFAFISSGGRYFWWILLEGVCGIAAGLLTLVLPGVTALSLLFLLGAWLIVSGLFRIATAVEFRKEIRHEWLLALSGVLAIVAGILTFSRPIQSAFAWAWVIGVYVVIYGVLLLALGFKVRRYTGGSLPSGTLTQH